MLHIVCVIFFVKYIWLVWLLPDKQPKHQAIISTVDNKIGCWESYLRQAGLPGPQANSPIVCIMSALHLQQFKLHELRLFS